MVLLDTNVCIRLLNGTSDAVAAAFRALSPSDIRLCSVVKAELHFGARKSHDVGRVLMNLERFFRPLISLGFDDRAAVEYGVIRADLERAGTPIGANDLLIAAIARAHDLTLVTHNLSEFGRVSGLRLQDWEAGSTR